MVANQGLNGSAPEIKKCFICMLMVYRFDRLWYSRPAYSHDVSIQ